MSSIIFIIAVVFLLVWIVSKSRSSQPGRRFAAPRAKSPRRPDFDQAGIPQHLGLRSGIPLGDMEKRMDDALDAEWLRSLKARVRAKYPAWSEAEYEWKLLELKRYFMMTAVLKQVPMYSEDVDAIWHEMLMFTREYAAFGDKFAGSAIHHAPHGDSRQPNPGEKAWFDWVYAHLFEPTPFSAWIWNGFFRVPLPENRMLDFKHLREPDLLDRLYNTAAAGRFEEIAETARILTAEMKVQIRRSENGGAYEPNPSARFNADPLLYLAGGAVFYSMVSDSGSYQSEMDGLREADDPFLRRNDANFSGCSACSGFGDSSGGGSSDGGSGSSCSSSSCGGNSSCGGGGGD